MSNKFILILFLFCLSSIDLFLLYHISRAHTRSRAHTVKPIHLNSPRMHKSHLYLLLSFGRPLSLSLSLSHCHSAFTCSWSPELLLVSFFYRASRPFVLPCRTDLLLFLLFLSFDKYDISALFTLNVRCARVRASVSLGGFQCCLLRSLSV